MTKKQRKSSTLTKLNIDTICQMVKNGVPKSQACAAIGVHRITLFKWIKEAEALVGTRPRDLRGRLLLYMLDEFNKAQAEFCKRCTLMVQSTGKDDWRSWAFLLERRFPNEFGQHQTQTIDIKSSPAREALDKIADALKGITDEDDE